MTPVEALNLALAKEKEARDLYKRLAEEHPVARQMFLELVIEEEKHAQLIKNKLAEIIKY